MFNAPSSVRLCFSLLDGCFQTMPCHPLVVCLGYPLVSHSDVAVSSLVCFVWAIFIFSRGFLHTFLEALGSRVTRDEMLCSQQP